MLKAKVPAHPQGSVDTPPPPTKTKLQGLTELLKRPDGARMSEMMALTGWQAHSVRGAVAGTLKKKLGLSVTSEKIDGERVYSIATGEAAR